MEQYFRIALGMFLFVGYLQATPIPTCDWTKGRSELLTRNVSCEPGVNFTSPTNVKDGCLMTALKTFMTELERAKTQCNVTNNGFRVNQTLRALNKCQRLETSPDCKNEGSLTNFEHFVGNLNSLMERIKSIPAAKQ